MLIGGSRRAFSIAEILVALAIVAIISAVVIPTMGGLITQSDGSRIAADLTAVQTGIKAFASDVHRYPGAVAQLSTIIDGSSLDISASSYPVNLRAKWQGPYLVRNATSVLRTVDLSPTFTQVTGDNGVKYLTIQLNNVPSKDFDVIESILDPGTPNGTSSSAGVVRYAAKVLQFLAVPLM